MEMKNDAQLQREVRDKLESEPSINAAEISVSVHDGVVTLRGHVPNYGEKRAAERAARRVSGVKTLTEQIEVS